MQVDADEANAAKADEISATSDAAKGRQVACASGFSAIMSRARKADAANAQASKLENATVEKNVMAKAVREDTAAEHAKTPQTPRTPRTPKTPKTPQTPRTPSGSDPAEGEANAEEQINKDLLGFAWIYMARQLPLFGTHQT